MECCLLCQAESGTKHLCHTGFIIGEISTTMQFKKQVFGINFASTVDPLLRKHSDERPFFTLDQFCFAGVHVAYQISPDQ